MTDTGEGGAGTPAALLASDTPAGDDTITAEVGQQQQPHDHVGEEGKSGGLKRDNERDSSGAIPGASDALAAIPDTDTGTSGGGDSAAVAGAAEGGGGQAGSKRSPRVGSVRQGRKEKRRAGWEAKKALIKEKKRAEREKREEAMRKEGLEIPTAGVDYRALPKEQWSVSQRIRDAKRQEFEKSSTEGGYRVCFDMAFDDLMLEKAQASLVQQVLYAYGSNRKAAQPCRVTLSGMGTVMTAKVNKLQGFNTWLAVNTDSRCYTEIFDKEDLVYLSADAPHTITQLEKGKVYIIGGLVDRNSQKGKCFNKATGQGIKCVRLPLKQESLHGSHSKVLATNHVFDILLRAMAAGGDLQNVETKALPPRKRAGWTGGDDRGSSSKPTSPQADVKDPSDSSAEEPPDPQGSNGTDLTSYANSDRSCVDGSGKAEAIGEGAVEEAEGVEISDGVTAAGRADVEKSEGGQAKVAGEGEAQDNGSGVEPRALDGNRDGLDAGLISTRTCGAVEVKNGEAAISARGVEGEGGNVVKRAAENIGEGSSSSNVDSKRPKTESQGDG